MDSQHNQKNGKGQLFIVATPIGNLEDLTFRAVKVLQAVALIAAEDTRVSRRLLERYGITTPMIPCHEHNEPKMVAQLAGRLAAGESVALISDAGTPLINDPGFRLVREIRKAGFDVVPVPGACSPVVALSASGMPTDQFVYLGFPPRSGKARSDLLQEIATMRRTAVLLESPNRLLKTLADMAAAGMEQREVCVARELTKLYESFVSGSAADVRAHFEAHPPRGEIVLMIAPAAGTAEEIGDDVILALLAQSDMQALPPSSRAKAVAARLGVAKSRVYALITGRQ